MKLTPRLEKIASLVDRGCRVADIGTDHGYIPVYLLENKIVDSAILADINRGPLDNARTEIEKNGFEKCTSLRLGSGLRVLEPGEADEIIIAGMGGILISDILDERKDVCRVARKLILQPMQAQSELRRYLAENNFRITDECFVNEDFRIYEIIEAVYEEGYRGQIEEDDIYYEVSRIQIEKKEPLFEKFVEKKIRECDSILEKLENSGNMNVGDRVDFIKNKKKKLENIIG